MRCEIARESLSARLDGETLDTFSEVDEHLAGCAGCRAWLARAERLNRMVRVPMQSPPDLTERILAAAQREGALPQPAGRPGPQALRGPFAAMLRWALAALAIVQLFIAAPELIGSVGHDAHAGREVAAFDIALAVGLLIVACYPQYARIYAPVVTTLVLCFVTISAVDVAQGVVTPSRVAVHVIALAQAAAVWLLSRRPQPIGMIAR